MAANQRPTAIQVLETHVARRPEQVQALFTLARLRYFGLGRDPRPGLWAVRKELQVALSRIDRYESAPAPSSELGLDLRDAAALRAELQALMLRVEARLGASEASK